jgi:hypothetical protein
LTLTNERWVVFDKKSIIYEGPDSLEAEEIYNNQKGFDGDLYIAQVIAKRR